MAEAKLLCAAQPEAQDDVDESEDVETQYQKFKALALAHVAEDFLAVFFENTNNIWTWVWNPDDCTQHVVLPKPRNQIDVSAANIFGYYKRLVAVRGEKPLKNAKYYWEIICTGMKMPQT